MARKKKEIEVIDITKRSWVRVQLAALKIPRLLFVKTAIFFLI